MQQHPGQDAACAFGQPPQEHAADKSRDALRQIQMQQCEQKRRAKNCGRTAGRAHQPLQRPAEKQFLEQRRDHAEAEKTDQKSAAARGKRLAAAGGAQQPRQQAAEQVGRIGHAQKQRKAEQRAPRHRPEQAQVLCLQAGQAQQQEHRNQNGRRRSKHGQNARLGLRKADGVRQRGPLNAQAHQKREQDIKQRAGGQISDGCQRAPGSGALDAAYFCDLLQRFLPLFCGAVPRHPPAAGFVHP